MQAVLLPSAPMAISDSFRVVAVACSMRAASHVPCVERFRQAAVRRDLMQTS